MTTPTTKAYTDARLATIKKYETGPNPQSAFYLDGCGFVTIGYGTLVFKDGRTSGTYAQTVIDKSPNPAFTKTVVDAFDGAKDDTFAASKTKLEAKGFVFDGSKMVGYEDGTVVADGKSITIDINNVLLKDNAEKPSCLALLHAMRGR